MNGHLLQILDAFPRLHVLVIGEAMLDRYLEGASDRLCQEAPVPVVSVQERREAPGGAANTAVNVRALGASVSLLSTIGDDYEGRHLCQALQARDVSADLLHVEPTRKTLAKTRVIASSQVLVRFDQGDTTPIGPAAEARLIERLIALYPKCDAVIVSDYGYGVLTPRIISTLAELQARHPRTLVGDSKRLAAYDRVGMTAVKPNYREALQLLGARQPDDSSGRAEGIVRSGPQLLEITGAKLAAVTLDTEGAVLFEAGGSSHRTYARPNPQSRAAGAGDTFASALALALAAGADYRSAGDLAAAAAGAVVAKDGTAACSAGELRASLAVGEKVATDLACLAARLDDHRRRGRRIVLTNGCFDILHSGHVQYLNRARSLGDLLIVGVNSDESIRRLKGPHRPINMLHDRLQVLAALGCIDYLIPFDEDTPHNLVRGIRPEVFVKGGDYTIDRLPEAALVQELGGVVHILPFVDERSTTGLIERIRGQNGRLLRPAAVGNGQNGHTNGVYNGHATGNGK